jgi:hypothetical protein
VETIFKEGGVAVERMRLIKIAIVNAGVLLVFLVNTVAALPIRESVESIADRLVSKQNGDSVNMGIWPKEGGFTGSIAAGMVDAYELTCDPNYKESAELGGYYILWSSFGSFFYGDEAYALTRLSQISDDPNNNIWHDALDDFFWFVKTDPGGTQEYIERFDGAEPSTAVFYLAGNVVAAYYANAQDKQIWRQGLIDWLSLVDDDTSIYPVMATGVATWALAKTTPLNEKFIDTDGKQKLFWDKLIDPCGLGAPYWKGKKLLDLPNLLMSHQVPDGQPNEGSFYWRFEYNANDPNSYPHELKDPNGYTEDAIFAAMGLAAMADAARIEPNDVDVNLIDPNSYDPNSCDPNLFDKAVPVFDPNTFSNIEPALLKAREALINGIDPNGLVFDKLSQKDKLLYMYAGEMLQAIKSLNIPGDIDMDGQVNCSDLEILLNNWQVTGCKQSCWCSGSDINRDGIVDINDFTIIVDNWLRGQM